MLEYSYKVNKWNEAGDGLNWKKNLKKTAMVPIHGKGQTWMTGSLDPVSFWVQGLLEPINGLDSEATNHCPICMNSRTKGARTVKYMVSFRQYAKCHHLYRIFKY